MTIGKLIETEYEIKQRIAEYHRRSKPYFDTLVKLYGYKTPTYIVTKGEKDIEVIYPPDTEFEVEAAPSVTPEPTIVEDIGEPLPEEDNGF